jgi:acylglycerol lipase
MIATTEEKFKGTGGDIFFRSWKPAGKPRGIIAICHGFNSHGGQYIWTAEQFQAAGFSAYAIDLRGRGKSDGRRFYVDDMADYVADLSGMIKIAKAREPGFPLFLLGHSAGGLVSCTFALENQRELAGLICESFAFRVPAPGFALAAIKGLAALFPRLPVLTLKTRDFTRDPKVLAALDSDPFIANEKQPAKTVAALVRAAERLQTEFPKITLPVLIMHGTLDKATLPAGSQFFYDTAGSKDKTLKLYEGHVHDLLGDVGREKVIGDVIGWVEARLPK